MKPLAWVASSKDDLCDFPDDAKREAGYQLHKVQSGEQPSDFKPMQAVGSGVYEIRIRERGDQYRVLYVAKFEEAVYVLHAFQKKSRKTPHHEIEMSRQRYQYIQEYRERT